MTYRPIAAVLAAALGAAALLPRAPLATAGDNAVEPPLPTVIPANDEEKKKTLDLAATSAAEGGIDALAAALVQMHERRCDEFVPLIRANLEHDDAKVQAAAVTAAAAHELKDVEKTVRKVLRAKPKKGLQFAPGAVTAACIDYLGRLAITGEEETVLKEHLRPTVGDERRLKLSAAKDIIRASVQYFGRTKWKPAVPYMIDELLGQPMPKDPNDPKNPPAAYWELRTKHWYEYEGWTRWALKETTGQEYRSVREWQAWLKTQDKKAFK